MQANGMIQTKKAHRTRRAFTLVELLVVVAIIALLISIALPSFRRARIQAKVLVTQSTFRALETGIESFRSQLELGGKYPPSMSDFNGRMVDPIWNNGPVRTTGASLLCYALAGPDNQGTVGFNATGGFSWAEQVGGRGSGGWYDTTDLTGPDPAKQRFGPYVEGKVMEEITMVNAFDAQNNPIGMYSKGLVASSGGGPNTAMSGVEQEQRFFVDGFKRPILYYRARRAAKVMIHFPGNPPLPGTYDHRDNALFTGGTDAFSGANIQGTLFVNKNHRLRYTRYGADPLFGDQTILDTNPYPFDAYIIDNTVTFPPNERYKARPVRADSFLLVSSGPDGIYGTPDDDKYWTE